MDSLKKRLRDVITALGVMAISWGCVAQDYTVYEPGRPDPVSALGIGIGSYVGNRMVQDMGYELQTKYINFQGEEVTFQYQRWKIIEKTVCGNKQGHTQTYSKCTKAAKALFETACDELRKSNSGASRNTNMYCSAALSYKPVIAEIKPAREKTEFEILKEKCNRLIMEASITNTAQKRAERDKACKKE